MCVFSPRLSINKASYMGGCGWMGRGKEMVISENDVDPNVDVRFPCKGGPLKTCQETIKVC